MKQRRKSNQSFNHSQILKNEINHIQKNLRTVDLRIGLIFPNKYRIGMANLALKIIYSLWNSYERVYVERIFLPENSFEGARSIETDSPLKSFDVLAVTIQFELDYVNFIRMLSQGGIPLYRNERDKNKDPIIIAGGPAVTTNPLPMADFLDIVIQGEVEPITDDLLVSLYERNIETLKNIKGIYLPNDPPNITYYSRIQDYENSFIPTAQVRNTNDANWKESQILGGYLIQPCRGCNRGCKFCLIGRLTRPLRERSLKTLEIATIEGTNQTKTKHLTLIGSGVGDYSKLTDYLHFLNENKLSFSIPSIRADSNQSVIDEIVFSGQKTITIAPEVGSDEYRYEVGKRISNDTFFSFAEQAKAKGITNLKMYFILGLPNQSMDEIDSIVSFCSKISSWFEKRNLNLTIGPFVPKYQTQFARYEIDQAWLDKTNSMIKKVKNELKSHGSLHIGSTKWSVIQAILSTGDRSLSNIIEKVSKTEGRYQDWVNIIGKPIVFLEQLNKKENFELPLPLVG